MVRGKESSDASRDVAEDERSQAEHFDRREGRQIKARLDRGRIQVTGERLLRVAGVREGGRVLHEES